MRPLARLRLLLHTAARQTRRLTYAPRAVATGWWDDFVTWVNGLDLSENALLLAFAVVVGLAGAAAVIGFYRLIDLAYVVFFEWTRVRLSPLGAWIYRPLVTALGLAAAWALMRRFAPGFDGGNVADIQRRVVRDGGRIPARPILARSAAAAVTLGSGGSAGSEGPVAVLGATAGSVLARLFRFGASRVTLLAGAGAAAGISAAFNAPLAGAFFALEEIIGAFSVGAFPVVVVASVVAAVVTRAAFGNHPAFPVPVEYGYRHLSEVLLFYPLLGILAGAAAALFIRTYFRGETLAARLRLPPLARPLAAGALTGLLVVASDGLLVGDGHLAIPVTVFGKLAWWTLLLLAAGKIAATTLTLNGGGSGGLFTPSLFIGAALGGAWGVALRDLLPGLALQPEAYALVGMGALTAAATGAPITGILLVFEMTDDYAIMLPLMLSTVLAWVTARRLAPDNLYSGWLRRRGIHLEHGTDRDVLGALRVAESYEASPVVLRADESVHALVGRLAFGTQTIYPVLDADGRLTGMLHSADLGALTAEQRGAEPPLTAADVARAAEACTLETTMRDVVRRLGVLGVPALPVVDPATGRCVGLVSRGHVLGLYERRVRPQEAAG